MPTATVRLRIGDQTVQQSAWGDGPVDAAYAAIGLACGTDIYVENYAIRAITSGSQALGEVTVHLSRAEEKVRGRGVSTDVIEASAKAYVDALNRLVLKSVKEEHQTV